MSQAPREEDLRQLISRAAEKDASEVTVDQSAAEEERKWLEIEQLRYEIDLIRQERLHTGDIHIARIIGLAALFILVIGWLTVICVFVYQSGKTADAPIKLSDSVIIALISSTTVNVLGLFLVAAKWLYGNRHEVKGGNSKQ